MSSILPDFNNGFVLGEVKLNENPMLGGGKPYHFTVSLRADKSNQLDEQLVREIIERYKDRKSTRLNSSHPSRSRMPSSA